VPPGIDAVVVPWEDGPGLLAARDGRGGPVVVDRARDAYTWLVAPGATRRWGRVTRVRLPSGPRHTVDIPPAGWTRNRPLRRPAPPRGDCLTDAAPLLDALLAALRARGLPHPYPPVRALRRCACGALLVVDGEAHACPAAVRR
jgi:hypothetical protein